MSNPFAPCLFVDPLGETRPTRLFELFLLSGNRLLSLLALLLGDLRLFFCLHMLVIGNPSVPRQHAAKFSCRLDIELLLHRGNGGAHDLPNGVYFRCVHAKCSHKGFATSLKRPLKNKGGPIV